MAGAVQVVAVVAGAEKVPVVAVQEYVSVSPVLGSCAVAAKVTTSPGATVVEEMMTESITGAAFVDGVGAVACWAEIRTRISRTSIISPYG